MEAAVLAEELGFDSGWVGDHLSFHPPLLDALTSLAAVSARTERLVLGTGVLLLPMRNAVWTAKQLASIDSFAPGRLLFGVGVGGENPAEFEAAGVPTAQRGARLDEGLDIVTALLRGEAVDHPGPLLPTRSPVLEPAPATPPPLVVGGRSEAALRRAARRGDGWLGVWMSAARVAAVRAQLDEYAAEYGRPSPTPLLMVFVHVTDGPSGLETGRAEVAGFVNGQYGLPVERLERWVLVGDTAHVAKGLDELVAAGVRGFVLMPAASDPLEQFRRLARVRERMTTSLR
ncbi:LLM class flavin-dependent oxidoreductase [Pseudonocardia sp. N23]|uniref:LLM class flavin-dependent oxidoreductase n=1 Tax=Pseudonocardia sp. N23 TaxID=1987376 RepID=UPI00209BD71D|nr:LLM class flavin-dependent oxidoreductase [Pseudonocardia sp. N23]